MTQDEGARPATAAAKGCVRPAAGAAGDGSTCDGPAGDGSAIDAPVRRRAARPAPVRKPRARKAPARGARRKGRPARWSARREGLFLDGLAQTSNVAASARASGLSESTIYRRRQRDAEFRARWAAALREGVARLETMLLERALNGIEKPVWHGGKQVGTMTEYSDRLALALLNAHRGGGATGAQPIEEVRAGMLQRLSEMNRAMGGEG